MSEVILSQSQQESVEEKQTVQDKFIEEYKKTNNPLWFSLKIHSILHPEFICDELSRGPATGKLRQVSKGLYEQLVNRCCSSGKTGGLKNKVHRSLYGSLSKIRDKHCPNQTISWVLLKALAYSSPDRVIISSRYGSGVLTRAVKTTLKTKVNHFLKLLVKNKKTKKFSQKIAQQIESALNQNLKSVLLTSKKETDNIASKANIQ